MEGGETSWRNFSPSGIGDGFACITTTSDPINKRRPQRDSAHQIGLKPTLHAFLIVVESGDTGGWKSWRNFSPSGIGDIFVCISTTIDPMDKRRAQADSAHQIGLKPTLHAFLIVVESGDTGGWKCCRNFSSSEIGDVFACISTTIDPMDKRRAQADSARQIGLKPTLHAFLIVGCWCCTRGWRRAGGIFCSHGTLEMFTCTVYPTTNPAWVYLDS